MKNKMYLFVKPQYVNATAKNIKNLNIHKHKIERY